MNKDLRRVVALSVQRAARAFAPVANSSTNAAPLASDTCCELVNEMTMQTDLAAPPAARPSRELAGTAVRGGVVLMAARLLMQAFTWAVTVGVARLLEPADYGLM